VRKPRADGGRASKTLTFPTTTAGLVALGDWLTTEQVTLVGMESTGVYWKPVFFMLEDRVPEVWLLNAEHLRNVPGRKTDVADSAWIAQLIEHGLVRPSFVPPPSIRELRDLTRHRRTLIEERTRVIQRLEKVLQDAGIKLSSVASTLLTKTGRAILDALLAGVSDPVELAELAKGRLRSKIPQLTEALRGTFRVDHHGLLVGQMLAHVDFLDEAIVTLDARITTTVAPYEPVLERVVTIPGIARKTAVSLVAEIGVDMDRFATPGHLASWAGICPGNNASGGRRKSGRTRHGSAWLKTALTEAAQAAAPHQGHLPGRAPRQHPRPTRNAQSDRRDPPRPTCGLLARRARPGRLHRPRWRLGHPPALRRAPRTPARPTTQRPRPTRHRHARDRRRHLTTGPRRWACAGGILTSVAAFFATEQNR